MNACFTYFTYSKDFDLLRCSIKSLQFWLPKCKIFVVDDKDNPISKEQKSRLDNMNVIYRQSQFIRNGNLNGVNCICGIIDELKKSAEESGANVSFKIDSDCFMFDYKIADIIKTQKSPKVLLLKSLGSEFLSGYGMFYGIPTRSLDKIKESFLNSECAKTKSEYQLPEDVHITKNAVEIEGQQNCIVLTHEKNYFAGWVGNTKNYSLKKYSETTLIHFGQKDFGTRKEIAAEMFKALRLIARKRVGLPI